VLSSPVGLVMVAILAAGALATATPESSSVESTIMAAAPFDRDMAVVRGAAPRTVSAQQLQALRSDPAVKNPEGLAEYAWDFTDPDALPPGFGPLVPSASKAQQ
jgi:hypothetical protein